MTNSMKPIDISESRSSRGVVTAFRGAIEDDKETA
jgi:hypothetical protein